MMASRVFKVWGIALSVLMVAGCATGSGDTPASSGRGVNVAAFEVGGLGPQELQPGDCGVFLWSLSSAQLVFFSSTRQQAAQINFGGRDLRLLRLSANGAPIIGGQLTRQRFRNETMIVDVEMNRGDRIDGGVRVAESLLRVRHASGWSTVLPVAGIAACEANLDLPTARP